MAKERQAKLRGGAAVVLVCLFAQTSNLAIAQSEATTAAQPPTKTQLHGLLLGRYQALAGAWFVNEQCSTLEAKQSEQLATLINNLNVYTRDQKLATDDELVSMQNKAKQIASKDKYKACKEPSKQLVDGGYQLAWYLHQHLIKP